MRPPLQLLSCGLLALGASCMAVADVVTFELIPTAGSANDMSPDGRYIVGETLPANGFLPYIYDSVLDEMTILPGPGYHAVAVSDAGDVVLGDMPDPITGDEVAGIWQRSTNQWTSLGYLPNALACPSRSNGYELSADGSVAVGLSWDGCSGRGFRWSMLTGMVELEPLANGGNRASACSADGMVIGGFAQGSFSRTPTIWDGAGNGTLLDPPNGDALGEIYGMSDDGTILLGNWDGDASTWTYPALVRTPIANGSILPGWTGIPQDIADSGTVVGFDILQGNRRAWIQFNGDGPLIDLKSYIEANGGVLPPNTSLEVCQAISADGTRIIGHSFTPGAWIVDIVPDTCPADISPEEGDGNVDVFDMLDLLGSWGTSGPGADIAEPLNVVDVFDILELLGTWGGCDPIGACCIDSECSQLTEADCTTAGGIYAGNNVPCAVDTCVNNDVCSDAVDITTSINGVAVEGSNATATPQTFGGGDPELPAGSPSCQWGGTPNTAHSTVWYSFVAPVGGEVTITLCASELPFSDSTIVLFSGACGSLTEFACDEDGCVDFPYYSVLNAAGLTPGETYYLSVMNPGGWGGSVPGPFEFTITAP